MLLLFDIDGTLLIRAAREHGRALRIAAGAVHGIPVPETRVETAGRTDPAIARMLLVDAGVAVERIDERADALAERAIAEYARLVPDDLSEHVSPGIPEALDALEPDHDLALLTGNLEPIARIKLGRAGIGDRFPSGQGAFGSDSEDRTDLPDVARARAGGRPREETVVIGDTPLDIACARAGGVRVVAVATGQYVAGELRDADVVVERAAEIPAAIDSLA